MTGSPTEPELMSKLRLSIEATSALSRWAVLTERTIRLPTVRWDRAGYTDAVMAAFFVSEPGKGTRLVVAKQLPPGQATEPAAHARAVREAPAAFLRHLVTQPYDPIPLPSGEVLMFQGLAADSRSWHPMADMTAGYMPYAAEVLARSLIRDWNHDFTIETENVVDFLRREIGQATSSLPDGGLLGEASSHPWLRVPGEVPVANPLRLYGEDSLFAGEFVDPICGRTHGDMHTGNVLMRQDGGHPEPDSFVLIDLATYSSRQPIGQDLVRLLLSVTMHVLPQLSRPQLRHLLRVFVKPDSPAPPDLPPVAVEALYAVYRPAAQLTATCGDDIWRRQYLLTLIAQGLAFATFANLHTAHREWCFLLAGHAARELLIQLGRSREVPTGSAAVGAHQFAKTVIGSSTSPKPSPQGSRSSAPINRRARVIHPAADRTEPPGHRGLRLLDAMPYSSQSI
jgi:hypothetical protein